MPPGDAPIGERTLRLTVMCALVAGGALFAPQSSESPACVWYTQIGAWHLGKDSIAERSYLYHNALRDGARSGEALTNVKLNCEFEGLERLSALMSTDTVPTVAGLFVKNKQVTFYVLAKRYLSGDSLCVVRYSEKQTQPLRAASARFGDTLTLVLDIRHDSLCVTSGETAVTTQRPADFVGMRTVGIICTRGAVRLWHVRVDADNMVVDDSLQNPQLLNLHLGKMLGGAKQ